MMISLDSKTLKFDDAVRDVIIRHLRYALTKFEREVSRVRVDGKAVNGRRRATETDQVCRITASLNGGTTVTVCEEAAELLTAAARAADRLGRAVDRAVDRAHAAGSRFESSFRRRSSRLKS